MLISDFARLGRVSVRMLRHYDAMGLLVPDHVDPCSGYRSYSPEQLHVLNRLVALKDLGFSLDQVRGLLAELVGIEELRGMLRLRRVELEEEARVVGSRLTAVESRLRMIEQEHDMNADYVVKTLPAARLAAHTALLDTTTLSDHIGPMFKEVGGALRLGPDAAATAIATYDEVESGMNVAVGFTYEGPVPEGIEVMELPETQAVCAVHLGPMETIGESWQGLHRWTVENGFTFAGPCREVYVRADSRDQLDWVTELQQPVTR